MLWCDVQLQHSNSTTVLWESCSTARYTHLRRVARVARHTRHMTHPLIRRVMCVEIVECGADFVFKQHTQIF
jgi:hypothetical protein